MLIMTGMQSSAQCPATSGARTGSELCEFSQTGSQTYLDVHDDLLSAAVDSRLGCSAPRTRPVVVADGFILLHNEGHAGRGQLVGVGAMVVRVQPAQQLSASQQQAAVCSS